MEDDEKVKVNRYRSGTKNPKQEVHVFSRKGLIKVHIVDYEQGRVQTLEKQEEEPK